MRDRFHSDLPAPRPWPLQHAERGARAAPCGGDFRRLAARGQQEAATAAFRQAAIQSGLGRRHLRPDHHRARPCQGVFRQARAVLRAAWAAARLGPRPTEDG